MGERQVRWWVPRSIPMREQARRLLQERDKRIIRDAECATLRAFGGVTNLRGGAQVSPLPVHREHPQLRGYRPLLPPPEERLKERCVHP